MGSDHVSSMTSAKRSRKLPIVTAILTASIAAFIWKNGTGSLHRVPQWVFVSAKLKLLPLEDASAGPHSPYERTKSGPLSLAAMVKEMRDAWPAENISLVHTAALEVATALLHRSDIEAGELVDGKFVPYQFSRWHLNELMTSEVGASSVPFDNQRIYVFRRK
jgi:hypothetical protein